MNASPQPSSRPSDGLRSPRVEHLIRVARRMFIEAGFEGVSLDGISREAGVSKDTIYRHFTGKEDLFRACVEGLRARFSVRAESILEEKGPPEQVLAHHARAIHDSAVEGGFLSAVWLTVAIWRAVPDLAVSMHEDALQRLEPLRVQLERIAASGGEKRRVPLTLAADFGSLTVQGPRHLMGWPAPSEAEREALARQTARFFLRGRAGIETAATLPHAPSAIPVRPESKAWPPHIATLMRVAYTHFLDKGFEGASLDEIGTVARVGRGTLYRHFGNKAGLFEAVLLDAAAQIGRRAPPMLDSGEAALPAFLAAAAEALTGTESIALHRLAITEAKRAPALARSVYEVLRGPWTRPLAVWLGDCPAADWLADQLVTLATMGNRPFTSTVDDNARAAAVGRATAIFAEGFKAAI